MTEYQTALIESHLSLAQRLAKGARGIPFDDAISAAYEGLTLAALKYDPSRDVRFATYAGHVMLGHLADERRNWLKHQGWTRSDRTVRRKPWPQANGEDRDDLRSTAVTPETIAMRREALRAVFAGKPRHHRQMIAQRLAGWTLKDSARAVGLSYTHASRVMRYAVA